LQPPENNFGSIIPKCGKQINGEIGLFPFLLAKGTQIFRAKPVGILHSGQEEVLSVLQKVIGRRTLPSAIRRPCLTADFA